MGSGPALNPGTTRRSLLLGAAAWPLAACRPAPTQELQGGWVGAGVERGHRLREPAARALNPQPKRAAVVIVGAGIAGLAAARGFLRQGVDDVHLLELEDSPGGNSRGHRLAGMPCPLGAHYLPLQGPEAIEVSDWMHEIGLLRQHLGRSHPDERHLCHSPQERLFFEGAWHDGLLPPAEPGSATMRQYQRFAALVASAPRFTIPSFRTPWTAEHAALDRQTFAAWLDQQHLDDPQLRWYLDYCCRDDYGAGLATVSAWAGMHYFASRHGFHAPGDAEADRDPVFTWPEGNAWLVERLAAPLAGRIHTSRIVHRVREGKDGVELSVWHGDRAEIWHAATVVLALPLFIAARVLEAPPPALRQAAARSVQAPWLVANLQLDQPLLDRPGAAPAWDNVAFGTQGLGYVDATHQSLLPVDGATVLTAYVNIPVAQRAALLGEPWSVWAGRVLAELVKVHPDLPPRLQRIDLMRYGHAMSVPVPGLHDDGGGRQALRGGAGRIRFAHADLAGYSVFEEAFMAGTEAARAACRCA